LLGEQNDHVALIYWKMGHCWKHLRNSSNALTCYEKAYNILRSIHGECSRQVENIYSTIISFYYEQQKYDKALEVFQKLLPITKSIEGESSEEYKQLLQQIAFLKNQLAQ
jgi:pentatricopeptide repeat protein